MTASTPCLRHSARVWLASCEDCTAWHLSRQIKRPTSASDARPRSAHLPAA